MACTPLSIDAGLFFTTSPWEQTATKSFDGKTVTFTAGGPNPGIGVQKGGQSLFHAKLNNHVLHYAVFGSKFLVILDVQSGGTAALTLVNFDTMTEGLVFSLLASSATNPVVVNPSAGSGSVSLAYGQDGTGLVPDVRQIPRLGDCGYY